MHSLKHFLSIEFSADRNVRRIFIIYDSFYSVLEGVSAFRSIAESGLGASPMPPTPILNMFNLCLAPGRY